MIAKLLWNPYLDFEEEYNGAMEFFYEESAPYIKNIEKKFIKNVSGIPMFHPGLAYTIMKEHYSDEFLLKATELFEQALEKAKTAEVKLRIRRDYVCLKFIKMYFNKGKNQKEMDDVIQECKYLGVTFSKMNAFIRHFYLNEKEDLFIEEIEERNKKADYNKLMEILR